MYVRMYVCIVWICVVWMYERMHGGCTDIYIYLCKYPRKYICVCLALMYQQPQDIMEFKDLFGALFAVIEVRFSNFNEAVLVCHGHGSDDSVSSACCCVCSLCSNSSHHPFLYYFMRPPLPSSDLANSTIAPTVSLPIYAINILLLSITVSLSETT